MNDNNEFNELIKIIELVINKKFKPLEEKITALEEQLKK